MYSWMEVLSQWKQGVVYPRWAALAHWGYGEARFLFYPPASWTLGAALGAILPWKLVPGAYLWIALTLAGLSMYRLASEWMGPPGALFAALFYAVNPYHLVIVYWRSAMAELLAAALLPLLLLEILRLKQGGIRSALRLAMILAASWLTNAPSAVMIHYSAAGLAVLVAVLERSWRPLVLAALAVLLGMGLSGFYLIPAGYEEKWVNIAEVLAPGVRPADNFLFTKIADADHNQFNRMVSTVAAAEIAVLTAAIFMAGIWRSEKRNLWIVISSSGALAAVIMLSFTNPLWEHLPKLRFVQLPWRWLLILNAVLAVLLAVGLGRWGARILACAALVSVVVLAGYKIQHPWWDTAADIKEMQDAVADGRGYEGTDEYVPAGADPYELSKDSPRLVLTEAGAHHAETLQWHAEEKHFILRTTKANVVTLRLFNYPAWQVTVNGKQVSTNTTDVTGQMQVPLGVGVNDVRIRFGRTRDRTIGGIVSLVSWALLLLDWIKTKRVQTASPHRTASVG